VVQGGHGPGFDLEPGPAFRAEGIARKDGLERHFPAQVRVPGQEDPAHGALAQQPEQLELADGLGLGRIIQGGFIRVSALCA
jgi:hypothetical protein